MNRIFITVKSISDFGGSSCNIMSTKMVKVWEDFERAENIQRDSRGIHIRAIQVRPISW